MHEKAMTVGHVGTGNGKGNVSGGAHVSDLPGLSGQ
jgi:hypothetical protein